ncbi:MAG TPA: hypothetical protein DCE42_29930 [Myxococcales bacterium]|nr:hypothetical protein [Deltaproteobacteria bacterium]MBU49936.1 hypothetical protein [Deltaproteobacteria bacterium]HAA59012.1 hypothetical protein [Myxococcales bacterium]
MSQKVTSKFHLCTLVFLLLSATLLFQMGGCRWGLRALSCITSDDCPNNASICVRGTCKPTSDETQNASERDTESHPKETHINDASIEPLPDTHPQDEVNTEPSVVERLELEPGTSSEPIPERFKEGIPEHCPATRCSPYWLIRHGSNTISQRTRSLIQDKTGNIYITGNDGPDFFLAKFSPKGTRIWKRTSTSPPKTTYGSTGSGLTFDPSGNIIVTGMYAQIHTFEGKTPTPTNGGYDHSNIFIASYSPSGALQWVDGGGGTLLDFGGRVLSDGKGHLYISGTHRSFGSQKTVFGLHTLICEGYEEVFVAKYEIKTNTWLWVNTSAFDETTPTWGVTATDMKLTSKGEAIITGGLQHATKFGTTRLEAPRAGSGYIAKIDANGQWVWAQGISGSKHKQAKRVVLDAQDNIYIAGTMICGAKIGTITLPCSQQVYRDIFFAKLDTTGKVIWAKSLTGGGHKTVGGITLTPTGQLVLSGTFTKSLAYQNTNQATKSFSTHPSWQGAGLFIMQLSPQNGDVTWYNYASSWDKGATQDWLFANAQGELFLTGGFFQGLKLDKTDYFQFLSDPDKTDVYIMKLDPNGSFSKP